MQQIKDALIIETKTTGKVELSVALHGPTDVLDEAEILMNKGETFTLETPDPLAPNVLVPSASFESWMRIIVPEGSTHGSITRGTLPLEVSGIIFSEN